MDNPEKLSTSGTPDEGKHNTMCVGHYCTQTNTNNINKTTGGRDKLKHAAYNTLLLFFCSLVCQSRNE